MAKAKLSNIWIMHFSVKNWRDEAMWLSYFNAAQSVLKSPLTHLDTADPIRRRVESLDDAAAFASAFKERETSRWLFGKFSKIKFNFQIHYYRTKDEMASSNKLIWYIPGDVIENDEGRRFAETLFETGNRILQPFYSISDDIIYIKSKSRDKAVNIEQELLGVFWLTYFNTQYTDFFGREKFDELAAVGFEPTNGVTLKLGDSPAKVPQERRMTCERLLGYSSFVDPRDHSLKPPGRYALTFTDLA
jgi:hypothetical protein